MYPRKNNETAKKNLRRARRIACPVLFGACDFALAETQKLFAAPDTAQSTASSGSGSMAQTTLALVLVLAAIFAAAWLMRRLRKFGGVAGRQGIEVVAQTVLGSKERAVLLKVGGAHVLVGVAPGRVNLLHVLDAGSIPTNEAVMPADVEKAVQTPSFKSLFKQSLGLK